MGKNSSPRAYADNEAMAYSKHMRGSAQKLNEVATSIRGLNCEKALSELQFSKRRVRWPHHGDETLARPRPWPCRQNSQAVQ